MASIVSVTIHSEISEFPTEKRFDSSIKISELKKKLELITGANHESMKILLSVDDKKIGELDNNDATLSQFLGEKVSKESAIKFEVKDDQPSDLLSGDVPKYTIGEDKYLERPNNVRKFIQEVREKQTSSNQ